MGFLGNLIKGVVNTAVTPIAIVTDVVKGDLELNNTSKIVDNVIDSVGDGVDDLINGDLL
jgi:hypothetical protein